MRRAIKYLLLVLAVVLTVLIVGAAVGYHYLKGQPRFYRTFNWNPEERSILNAQAANKLALTRHLAADAHYAEVRAQVAAREGRPPETRPQRGPVTLVFTEDELNAFFFHNTELFFKDLRAKFEQYVIDPGLFLEKDELILAGKMREGGILVSFHFKPSIDEQGKLHLDLVQSMAGRLPVPNGLVSGQLQRVEEALRSRMPAWQHESKMDAAGGSNSSLVTAAAARLVLSALAHRPAPAVIFMPVEDKISKGKAMPLRIVAVQIDEDQIALTLQPMEKAEREAMLADVREPIRP